MFRVGQIFYNSEAECSEERRFYILSQVEQRKVCLIGLCDGNRWDDPVKVNKVDEITQGEMLKISNGRAYEWKLVTGTGDVLGSWLKTYKMNDLKSLGLRNENLNAGEWETTGVEV